MYTITGTKRSLSGGRQRIGNIVDQSKIKLWEASKICLFSWQTYIMTSVQISNGLTSFACSNWSLVLLYSNLKIWMMLQPFNKYKQIISQVFNTAECQYMDFIWNLTSIPCLSFLLVVWRENIVITRMQQQSYMTLIIFKTTDDGIDWLFVVNW